MNTNLLPRSASLAAALALASGLMAVAPSAAANVTYAISQTVGAGSVSGTITTDGDLGTLDASDIVSFNLVLQGLGAASTLNSSSSKFLLTGGDLVASGNQLNFNFSGNDNGYLLFQRQLYSGTDYWCNAVSGVVCLMGGSIVPQGFRDGSAQFDSSLSGLQTVGTISNVSNVPEPATWALLLAGIGAVGFYSRTQRRDGFRALSS